MMKRIVLITTSFPRAIAGSESAGSFVEDFSAMLGTRCQLAVVAPGFADTSEPGANYTIFRYRAPEKALSQLKLWSPPDVLKVIDVMRHGAAATARAVAELKPDFVFALWALPSGYWARQAVRGTGIPYGAWCLGSDIWSMGKIPVIRSLLCSVLRSAQLVCADGYVLGDDVEKLAGVKCHFLPSSRQLPLPPAASPRATAPYRLLFIGRWHPNKGTDLLVDALALLDDLDWTLISDVRIYGGGPQETEVRAKVAALQAAGRPVQVFGYIDKAGAARVLHECDWLLIPSRIESIPVVFSDAMQSQRPVISMPVGDLPRLVTEFGVGVLADDVSPASFAEAMRTALQKPAAGFGEGLARAARTFAVGGSVEQLLTTVGA